jgi:AcrR family transcriptional regulator
MKGGVVSELFALGDTISTEKQKRILEAALEVFAEKGFAGTPTAEIAKRAGVAEGTIFKHYKTKKDLLLGVVAPLFAKLIVPQVTAPVQALLKKRWDSVDDVLRALVTERVGFVHAHRHVLRVIAQEVSFHPELRDLIATRLAPLVVNDALAMIADFQARGLVRAAPPTSIMRLISGTVLSYVVSREVLFPERDWDDAAEIELMVEMLGRGLAP